MSKGSPSGSGAASSFLHPGQRCGALVEDLRLEQEADDVVSVLGLQRVGPAVVLLVAAVEPLPARGGELVLRAVDVAKVELLELVAQQQLLELGLLLDVGLDPAVLDLVQRRRRDVDVAGLDQVGELAIEEGEHQGADVGAVDVGVGHHDDLVVPRVLEVELLADAGADRGDHRRDHLVVEHLVDAALLDVEDLAAQRQHRLGVAVAALLRRAAGRVALDDEQLRQRRVADRAVGELAGQGRVLQRRLAPGQVASLAGRRRGRGRRRPTSRRSAARRPGAPRGTRRACG